MGLKLRALRSGADAPLAVPTRCPWKIMFKRGVNLTVNTLVNQVPVPVFLPASLDSSEKIPAAVEELKSKVSSDSLDAELLTMTDMMAEDEGKTEAANINSELHCISPCE